MNNIVLVISLLLAFVTGFYCAVKSIHLGLKWQIQTAEKKEPELKTPIKTITDALEKTKIEAQNKERAEFIKEYSPFQE